ncbi:glycosyltransferase family 31 protein [Amanita rubescens]|nr:glycosyltransferase family 31 protein [Amanita rubescens]
MPPSSTNTTPLPSHPPSPNLAYFSSQLSCTSDSESDVDPPYLRLSSRPNFWWREDRGFWWSQGRRRPRSRFARCAKRWTRRFLRLPFVPGRPVTVVLTLISLCVFGLLLTLLLIYILNPDKEPLPWRAYCAAPELVSYSALNSINATTGSSYPLFNATHLDDLPPAGLFVGVFSIDSAFERRMLIRTTWASHPRSRNGAGDGDGSAGTSRTVVRFILGQPRKDYERRIKLEMATYNDIIILPVTENMNSGKTYTYFTWAAIDAWVPPIYNRSTTHLSLPHYTYFDDTASPPALSPHDPYLAWQDRQSGNARSWVRPDYVLKVDDDSFVMLAELEARLRYELYNKPLSTSENLPGTNSTSSAQSPIESDSALRPEKDPLIYWGYLVTNRLHQFMAGELYGLSWSLVKWVAVEPTIQGFTRGAEDKQTAKWMKMHPNASDIRWTSERCWIYDHPRSGTVYSHGFLFPSEVTRIKQSLGPALGQSIIDQHLFSSTGITTSPPASWSRSTVSSFRSRYIPPVAGLSIEHSVEALVEGSEMSMLREGRPVAPEYAWSHREGRSRRYEGARIGGTIVVHFVKKRMWFLETASSLLEGEEMSEFEKYRSSEDRRHESGQSSAIPGTSSITSSYATQRESLRFRSWHMR